MIMNSGDILSFAAAVGIVLVMVCIVNPPWSAPDAAGGETAVTPAPTPAVTTPPATPQSTPVQTRTFVPVKIEYAERPVTKYQTYIIPDLTRFGMSDPPWRGSKVASFAYIEEASGGVTDPFTVSYPVWRLTCTVRNDDYPENARFKMVLIEKETGEIIDGAEIKGPGTVVKNQEVSGKEFYLVVQSSRALFRIDLETREEYLDAYPGVVVKKP